MLAAPEGVDIVVFVDPDRGDLLERPALGQLCPVFDDAIPVFAGPDDARHALPSSPVPRRWDVIGRLCARQSGTPRTSAARRGGAACAFRHHQPNGKYLGNINPRYPV